jgi:hypothetical protein
MLAVKVEARVAEHRARQHARFEKHLKSVADAEHRVRRHQQIV